MTRQYPGMLSSISDSIRRKGGLAATFELYRAGHTRRELSHAVSSRQILRVRQGWYSHPDTNPRFLEAARVGGRLTCLSGVGQHGIWQYPSTELHVAVQSHACRLRDPHRMTVRLAETTPPDVRVHWAAADAAGSRFLIDPIGCLADLILCQPAEITITAADSALRGRHITPAQWRNLLRRMPAARTPGLDQVEARCESGIESLTRFRLLPFGLDIRTQVPLSGVGRVDFVIGQRLVIEVDGAQYHTDPKKFEDDRRRDAVLSLLGYRVLRFSYRQVIHHWAQVEAAILAAVIRGDHHP